MTLGQRFGRGGYLGILVAITSLHVAYRLSARPSVSGPLAAMSSLSVGDTVPGFSVIETLTRKRSRVPVLSAAPCQILVAFDPSCPHCRKAAEAEALAPDADLIPVTWIAPYDSLNAGRYQAWVHSASRVVRAREGWDFLDVQGVPAAFLVDRQNRIRRVWPYRGSESRTDLKSRCGSEATPAPLASSFPPSGDTDGMQALAAP